MGPATRHLGQRDNTGDRHPGQSTARDGCTGAAARRRLRCSWRPFPARAKVNSTRAICPQAITLVSNRQRPKRWRAFRRSLLSPGSHGYEASSAAVLAPPSLASGDRPVAQVGYPPLAFIDPQLLRGEGGRWSDIWALGALTVHQVVTGSAPFRGVPRGPGGPRRSPRLPDGGHAGAGCAAGGRWPRPWSPGCLAVDPCRAPADRP